MCILNNALLSNRCVKEEVPSTEYYEMSENEDTTYQNLLNEAVLI